MNSQVLNFNTMQPNIQLHTHAQHMTARCLALWIRPKIILMISCQGLKAKQLHVRNKWACQKV